MRWMLLKLAATIFVLASYTLSQAQEDRIQQLRRAAASIQQNNLDSAQSVLQSLLSKSPEDAVALNLLGLVRLQQRQTAEAEQLFLKAISSGRGIPGPYINLALLHSTDQPLVALDDLQRALTISPGNQQAEELVRTVTEKAAVTELNSAHKDQAIAIAIKARGTLPKDPNILYDFGMVCLEAGLYSDAQRALQQALQIRPLYGAAQYALVRVYLADNLAAQAEKEMQRYLERNPDDASAQYGLGYILVAEQKLEEAQSAFNKSLNLQPDQTESVYQLGEIALEQGHTEEADAKFSAALARSPHHAGALTGLGIIAFREGRNEAAQRYLADAVSSSPDYQKAHYYYALCLRKSGQKDRADQEFRLASDLQKKHLTNARLDLPSR